MIRYIIYVHTFIFGILISIIIYWYPFYYDDSYYYVYPYYIDTGIDVNIDMILILWRSLI